VGTRKNSNLSFEMSFDIQLNKSSLAMVNRDQREVYAILAVVLRWYSVFKGTDCGSGI
jgi:hypothetical protein